MMLISDMLRSYMYTIHEYSNTALIFYKMLILNNGLMHELHHVGQVYQFCLAQVLGNCQCMGSV